MTNERSPRAVVDALAGAGLLDPARTDEALVVVRGALGDPTATSTPLRQRLSEIAGYVGGAFVVGAAALFFGQTWDDLGLGGQIAVLLIVAAVLVTAAGGVVSMADGLAAVRRPAEAVRRRLTSVLLTGAAASTAFGVGLLLDDAMTNAELAVLLAALVGLAVCLGGYAVAPTTVGQLGAGVAGVTAIPSGLGALPGNPDTVVPLALGVLALGVVWGVLAERGRWHELLSARVIGALLAVSGAQIPLFDDNAWVAYLATALVGAVAFWLYVVSRAWPYLATGVVAVTLAVPEALDDWADGSLGAAGILLVTGVTLLVAALLGLRLRREVTERDPAAIVPPGGTA